MAMGPSKGHKATKNTSKQTRRGHNGRLTKRTKTVQDMIQEMCGFALCEQCAMTLLKAKDELSNILAATRKAAAKRD
ncbi:unnamed protein product [Nyctereutes procyonoides]|uniref:Large ribosomal subunit protein eL36 n=1 Tax=Nyctereutes procyonoides TaxID=34880 RepID=A0A811ZIM1_NYCPR|nr:unnamed protein product [Nyctereutes procyonoides]